MWEGEGEAEKDLFRRGGEKRRGVKKKSKEILREGENCVEKLMKRGGVKKGKKS